MKIIYLAAYKAYHPKWDVTYQDINGKRDISGDMMEVNLDPYDVIIATPPCNYWSRANYKREISEYSQKTKHLLPYILNKLKYMDKPFIVENVINNKLFCEYGLYNLGLFVYEIGRHTYWTNIPFNGSHINQIFDNVNNTSSSKRQGGHNVQNVIEYWLETIK